MRSRLLPPLLLLARSHAAGPPALDYTGEDGDDLGECQGDCDGDGDCEPGLGLRCYKRSDLESVPGCAGGGEGDVDGKDYCAFVPSDYLFWVGNDEGAGSYGLCEGDCDEDSDCQGELVCQQRGDGDGQDGYAVVSGCDGMGRFKADYCRNPLPAPCDGLNVTVRILTDGYPLETSWTLTSDCGGGTPIESDPFRRVGALFEEELCLPIGGYTFVVRDAYGDGICCAYGEGSYEVLADGVRVAGGGKFEGSEETTFGSCPAPTEMPTSRDTSKDPTKSPTDQPVKTPTDRPTNMNPTKSPTDRPTKMPTGSPTSRSPTKFPTDQPTEVPTERPTSKNPTLSPTNEPTQAPAPGLTPAPTTPQPTTDCNGILVRVDIFTDEYPLETSWTLRSSCDDGTKRSGGPFSSVGSLFSEELCLPAADYTFVISDSFGDGLCCSYGDGYYKVFADWFLVAEGAQFRFEEEATFGACPTPEPSFGPSTPPPTPCGGIDIEVRVLTDGWPGETTWVLTNGDEGTEVQSRGPYEAAGTLDTYADCLPNAEYSFVIRDSYGDGICCSYGDGYYQLLVDGNLVAEGAEFGAEEEVVFGSNPVPTRGPSESPTSVPTPPPTSRPETTGPAQSPTKSPVNPTKSPTGRPSKAPTQKPSTDAPTKSPTTRPVTAGPTEPPTTSPAQDRNIPTSKPSEGTSSSDTGSPMKAPTASPAEATNNPTTWPSQVPTRNPVTKSPSKTPTSSPGTDSPIKAPTASPAKPTSSPSTRPTKRPTPNPVTDSPTPMPTVSPVNPSRSPSISPSRERDVVQDPPTKSPSSSPTGQLVTIGNPPPSGTLLGKCQGDCDRDDNCEVGLLCYQRRAVESVPGCAGEGDSGQDYCAYRPSDYLYYKGSCDESDTCGPCEGDCDSDADCAEGLICEQRSKFVMVPGCDGTGRMGSDYCRWPDSLSPSSLPSASFGPSSLLPSTSPTESSEPTPPYYQYRVADSTCSGKLANETNMQGPAPFADKSNAALQFLVFADTPDDDSCSTCNTCIGPDGNREEECTRFDCTLKNIILSQLPEDNTCTYEGEDYMCLKNSILPYINGRIAVGDAAFVAHAGDMIKGSVLARNSRCQNYTFSSRRDLFSDARNFLIVPGDNDWSECIGYDIESNTDPIRELWRDTFANDLSPFNQFSIDFPQATGGGRPEIFHSNSNPEIFYFEYNRIAFFGLNKVAGESYITDKAPVDLNAEWVGQRLVLDANCELESIVLLAHAELKDVVYEQLFEYFSRCGSPIPFLTITGNLHPAQYCMTRSSTSTSRLDLTVEAFKSGPLLVSVVRSPDGLGDFFHVEDTDPYPSNNKCPEYEVPRP